VVIGAILALCSLGLLGAAGTACGRKQPRAPAATSTSAPRPTPPAGTPSPVTRPNCRPPTAGGAGHRHCSAPCGWPPPRPGAPPRCSSASRPPRQQHTTWPESTTPASPATPPRAPPILRTTAARPPSHLAAPPSGPRVLPGHEAGPARTYGHLRECHQQRAIRADKDLERRGSDLRKWEFLHLMQLPRFRCR